VEHGTSGTGGDPVRNEVKDAIIRTFVEIVREADETEMVPLVIVYGLPGASIDNPLKIKTAFDSMPEKVFSELARLRAMRTLAESL